MKEADMWKYSMNVLKKKTKCYKYAEFQDMEIVGEYSDEGYSGKNIIGWKMVNLSLQRMKRKGR